MFRVNNINVSEVKKYIFYHPELKKYFPEKTSQLHCLAYVPFNQAAMGASYQHEERLSNKRWEISSEIIGGEMASGHGTLQCIVLFHTPTNFVIEYLRVDIDEPIQRRETIIDGRRNMKEWVDQMSDKDINKRAYPKFRPDDNIKY